MATTITALPTPPSPADDPATFNSKAFATLGAQTLMVSEINALSTELNAANASSVSAASSANASKDQAASSASAALGSKEAAGISTGNAATSASNALYSAETATTQAGIAASKAAEAAASAASVIPTAGFFHKEDNYSVVFTKTGAGTISIKAGTVFDVGGVLVTFAAPTSVSMAALAAGTDYSIWVKSDGTLQAIADPYSAPAAAPGAGVWRKIGGFHYGLVAPGTTVAGGVFNTSGAVTTGGMVWTQGDVDKIAGINQFSLWDLKWTVRSLNGHPRGMALDPWMRTWVALYFTSTNHTVNGASAHNTDVASGTVLPRIPLAYGGNGTIAYPNGNWWTFNEIVSSFGLRLGIEREFVSAAFGVTENQSLGGASVTISATARQPGYTSRIGIEQASGHIWTWGDESSYRNDGTPPAGFFDVNGGRGQVYMMNSLGLTRSLFGGDRGAAASSGSRASSWNNYPWNSNWSVGVRAFGDHLVLF